MNEVPEKQPRIRWKFRHLLLMLLPGFVFLITYPPIYIACVKYEGSNSQTGPVGISTVIEPAINATAIAGVLSGITLTIMLPAVLRKAAAQGHLKPAEVALSAFAVIIVNSVLVFGGCSVGEHVIRGYRSAPNPAHTITPAP